MSIADYDSDVRLDRLKHRKIRLSTALTSLLSEFSTQSFIDFFSQTYGGANRISFYLTQQVPHSGRTLRIPKSWLCLNCGYLQSTKLFGIPPNSNYFADRLLLPLDTRILWLCWMRGECVGDLMSLVRIQNYFLHVFCFDMKGTIRHSHQTFSRFISN